MDSPRFFCAIPLSPGAHFLLPPGPARHAARALRLGPGDRLTLFDGRGGEYAASIERVDRDEVAVRVGAFRPREAESPLALTLVQALQAGDKMDLTVQKAVELGVVRIVPVIARRSVVRLAGERAARRVAHWRGVAESACEQCGRNRVPQIDEIVPLADWLGALPAAAGDCRLMLAPGAARTLALLPPPPAATLLVGAEGGLDPVECAAARAAGFDAVRLGPRVLRTETAGMAALAAMQALWGDFNQNDGEGGEGDV